MNCGYYWGLKGEKNDVNTAMQFKLLAWNGALLISLDHV